MAIDLKFLENRVDALIALGLQSEGVLATPINNIFRKKDTDLRDLNALKAKRNLPGVISDAELPAHIDEQYKKVVQDKFRPEMLKLVHGEAASFDMKDIAGLVGAATSTWGALQTLNPLNIIPAVMSLVSNSVVADWVRGAVMSFKDREKYPTIADAMQVVRLERSAADADKQFGFEPGTLFAALTAKDDPVASAVQTPAKPVGGVGIAQNSERVLMKPGAEPHNPKENPAAPRTPAAAVAKPSFSPPGAPSAAVLP